MIRDPRPVFRANRPRQQPANGAVGGASVRQTLMIFKQFLLYCAWTYDYSHGLRVTRPPI
jgi:hypothetical protein